MNLYSLYVKSLDQEKVEILDNIFLASKLQAILNKSWKLHSTKQQLYGHLSTISKTIQITWTSHVGHNWRSNDELISNVLLWTPSHGCASVGQPTRTYLQQLYTETGCSLEDLSEAMNDRDKWQERVREIHASSATWYFLHFFSKRIFNSLGNYLYSQVLAKILYKMRILLNEVHSLSNSEIFSINGQKSTENQKELWRQTNEWG